MTIVNSKCFSKLQLLNYLPSLSITAQYLRNRYGDVSCTPFYNKYTECAQHVNSRYRTIDGSCNNIFNPYWGRSQICHVRLLPADYSDGIQLFRKSSAGPALPNPRSISNYIAQNRDYHAYYTALVEGFGQFINHDISNTENHVQPSNKPKLDCCVKPDSKCAAILLQDGNDFITNNFKGKCLNFIRSSSCPLCKLGNRIMHLKLKFETFFQDPGNN